MFLQETSTDYLACLYVDDIIILEVILLESSISRSFILHASVHMIDLGALTYILGIKLTYAYDSLG